MTELSVIEAVEVDVDLEKEVPCDFRKDCPSPATWRLIRACCGYVELKCTEHKTLQLRSIQFALVLRCGFCGNQSKGYSTVEPL